MIRLERWDPLSFILLAHGLLLALSGEASNPLWVVALTGAMALIRLGFGWLGPNQAKQEWRFLRGALSMTLAYGVVVADGGVESPFFFWILLLLGWQVLVLDLASYQWMGGLTLVGYMAVLAITSDASAPALLRLGLLAAFILVLALGRRILDQRESEVARLDDVVKAIIDDAPMAISVLDSDRDRLLYANAAAHEMGIASREAMAHLLVDDNPNPRKITTLAELVVGAGFLHSPARPYRHIASPRAQYRIGFHPRRTSGADALVLIYGVRIDDGGLDADSSGD